MDRKKLEHYDFKQLMKLFSRKKWLIIGCILSFLVPVLIYNQQSVPVYRADSSIIYETEKGTSVILDQFNLSSAKNVIINQIEEIKSRSLIEEVVASLPGEILNTFTLPKKKGPDFNKEEFYVKQIQDRITASSVANSDIIKIEVEAYSPQAAKEIADAIIAVVQKRSLDIEKKETTNVREIIGEQLQTFKKQLDDAEKSLKDFKKQFNVTNIDKEAVEVLQRITEAENIYNQTKANLDAAKKRLIFVQNKLQKERKGLVPSITQITSPWIHKLKERLVDLEVQLTNLKVQDYSDTHPKVKKIKTDIAQTKKTLMDESLKIAAGENIVDPIYQIQKYMEESISLEIDIETNQAQEKTLKKVITKYERALNTLPDKELRMAQLMRDKEVNEKIYTMLLEKREETKIAEAERMGSIRILDSAKIQKNPIKPRKILNIVISILLGIVMGIGLVLLIEFLNTKVNSVEEIERLSGLNVAVTIPKIRASLLNISRKETNQTKKTSYLNLDSQLVTAHHPNSVYSEAFRTLTVNIQFTDIDIPTKKIILITSANPADGKSFVAANLAISSARMGFKTLLIDGDLRKPVLHTLFKKKLEPGLVNVLIAENSVNSALIMAEAKTEQTVPSGKEQAGRSRSQSKKQQSYNHQFPNESMEEVLQKSISSTDIVNLELLPCGTIPPNPSEQLASKAIKNTLVQLKNRYDTIIIDSPPINLVTDAKILSLIVDSSVLVVKAESSSFEEIQKSLTLLNQTLKKAINIVLNHYDDGNRASKFRQYYSNNNGQRR